MEKRYGFGSQQSGLQKQRPFTLIACMQAGQADTNNQAVMALINRESVENGYCESKD